MITTIHVLPITVIHIVCGVLRCLLAIMHITRRNPQRLRCQQYKNGKKQVFHKTIIHVCAFKIIIYITNLEARLLPAVRLRE